MTKKARDPIILFRSETLEALLDKGERDKCSCMCILEWICVDVRRHNRRYDDSRMERRRRNMCIDHPRSIVYVGSVGIDLRGLLLFGSPARSHNRPKDKLEKNVHSRVSRSLFVFKDWWSCED